MIEGKKYYVYVHRRKTDGRIFYVGKGVGTRAYKNVNRNKHWQNVFNKHGRTVHIIRYFENEFCALTYEVILIGLLGLENLTNKAEGGKHNSGWKHSQEWKEWASMARSGENGPNYGKPMSQEQKDKIAESLRGRPSPKKGKPSNIDPAILSSSMKRVWASAGPDSRLRNIVKTQGFLNKRKTEKPVITKCGMRFSGMADACRWLSENGWPKASHAAISYSCNHEGSIRYGFEWRYDDEK